MEEKIVLLNALKRLIPAHFDEVLFNYGFPTQYGQSGAQMSRAIEVIRYAEGRGELAQLHAAIEVVAGTNLLQLSASTTPIESSKNVEMQTTTLEARNHLQPIKLFYSYAHVDEKLRDKLAKHLKILQRQGVIDDWHDRAIDAGEEWETAIFQAMEEAQIILLLISDDFIASDYCWGKELAVSLAKHERNEARVIPVILRPVDWTGAPFSKLQALPKDAKPITSWRNIDEAMLDVVKGIRRVVESLKKPTIKTDYD